MTTKERKEKLNQIAHHYMLTMDDKKKVELQSDDLAESFNRMCEKKWFNKHATEILKMMELYSHYSFWVGFTAAKSILKGDFL